MLKWGEKPAVACRLSRIKEKIMFFSDEEHVGMITQKKGLRRKGVGNSYDRKDN